eukprot:121058-Pyramimonas_sp.AAC.1
MASVKNRRESRASSRCERLSQESIFYNSTASREHLEPELLTTGNSAVRNGFCTTTLACDHYRDFAVPAVFCFGSVLAVQLARREAVCENDQTNQMQEAW